MLLMLICMSIVSCLHQGQGDPITTWKAAQGYMRNMVDDKITHGKAAAVACCSVMSQAPYGGLSGVTHSLMHKCMDAAAADSLRMVQELAQVLT